MVVVVVVGMVCMCSSSSSERVEPWSRDGKWDGFWSIVTSCGGGRGGTFNIGSSSGGCGGGG